VAIATSRRLEENTYEAGISFQMVRQRMSFEVPLQSRSVVYFRVFLPLDRY